MVGTHIFFEEKQFLFTRKKQHVSGPEKRTFQAERMSSFQVKKGNPGAKKQAVLYRRIIPKTRSSERRIN